MLKHPVEEGFLKSDVTPLLLTLDPLVTQNLFSLRQKLPVKSRVLQEIGRIRRCLGSYH